MRWVWLAVLTANVAAALAVVASGPLPWAALLNVAAVIWSGIRFRELNDDHRHRRDRQRQIQDEMAHCSHCAEITFVMMEHLHRDHDRPMQERIP